MSVMWKDKKGGKRTSNVLKASQPGKPLISVITVVFNGAETLEDTIRSALGQTYDNVEYIVIDGGSADGTLEILHTYDAQIDYWISEPDAGIYDAMNKGLALASGEIVGFLNSDDFYAKTTVLEQIAQAFQDKELDAVYADLLYVSQDNRKVVRYWQSKTFENGNFAKGWCPAHPTFYTRASVVTRYGAFDQSFNLAADAELMMRYLEWGGIRSKYIPDVWIRMRVGGKTNQSLKNIVLQNKEIFRALEKNAVPFSIVLFAVSKIVNRAWQFVAGRKK
jgi:glycosyltransferase involved in cell wall biosynthesis